MSISGGNVVAFHPGEAAGGVVTRPLIPESAFGEMLSVSPVPEVQVRFPYNINTEQITTAQNHASNPTEVSGTVAMANVDATNSTADFDSAGTLVVGGTILETFEVAGSASEHFDLQGLGFRIRPGDRWVITSLLDSGSAGNVAVALAWRERV